MNGTPVAGDRFLIEQLIRPVVNVYRVSAVGTDGRGHPVAFVRQKRLALKEDIRFFAAESGGAHLFTLKARRVLEVGGRYDVTTPDGAPIGVLERRFGRSLFRSTWVVRDAADREVLLAQERSLAVSLLRRAWEFIPVVSTVPLMVPFHFTFLYQGRPAGGMTRRLAVRDKYLLDVAGIPAQVLDRRLAIALGIALDALQGR